MSDCRKCQDPDCTGGYKGGPAQIWQECDAVLRGDDPGGSTTCPESPPTTKTPNPYCACGIARSDCDYHR